MAVFNKIALYLNELLRQLVNLKKIDSQVIALNAPAQNANNRNTAGYPVSDTHPDQKHSARLC